MPATQEITVFDGLEINVEPVEEPDPVYFTSDDPEFNVHLHNNDAKYNFSEASAFRWTIETNPMQVVHTGEVEFGPLDHGEETTVTVGGDVLAYEGHGVLGISVAGASGKNGSDRWKLNAGRERSADPAYSFSVWDESDYNASIRRPKQMQLAMFGTSVILIFFALIQILLALGFFG
ncbi:hypothetical protein GJR96_02820 [Haloferax sp. MBLA0076]|uniref:Uncharacterized protein n=1 Tax=Haloferax litoreum TaxID=2666140 RepID=A0A6A8GFF9_9EURY|nr:MULTISPECIES: hypothetical protein [Haloferax]KAB1192429.1 hypothetical protein Hfx1148_02810 [Haloferax sp. CBA1148]MRX20897.1 hypothetical protein [Haloferax litoreum]